MTETSKQAFDCLARFVVESFERYNRIDTFDETQPGNEDLKALSADEFRKMWKDAKDEYYDASDVLADFIARHEMENGYYDAVSEIRSKFDEQTWNDVYGDAKETSDYMF